MATEVTVPTLGESITEATLGQWLKKPGDASPPTSRSPA
jgi:2-oxoglutarate dehydrogenase E2 component (dihydrolipoamide succinyltransferase)